MQNKTIRAGTRYRIWVRGVFIFFWWETCKAYCRLRSILCHDRMMMTRMLIGVSGLTWGFLLLDPAILFTDKRTTYLVMRAIASENAWGYAFLISGAVSLWAVLFDVRNRATILLDAVLGCILWTTSTLACFAAHWPHAVVGGWLEQFRAYAMPAAMSGELWLSIAAWWHCIRHLSEREVIVDRRIRGTCQ